METFTFCFNPLSVGTTQALCHDAEVTAMTRRILFHIQLHEHVFTLGMRKNGDDTKNQTFLHTSAAVWQLKLDFLTEVENGCV